MSELIIQPIEEKDPALLQTQQEETTEEVVKDEINKEAPKDKPKEEEGNKEEEEASKETEFVIGNCDMTLLAKEFEETGDLSEESYAELAEEGYPKEVVQAYIAGVKALQGNVVETAKTEVNSILQEVGGQEKYTEMVEWAIKNMSDEDIDTYNKAVESGDVNYTKLAVRDLQKRYEEANGKEPKLLTDTASKARKTTSKGYENRQEMFEAMRDKRYGRDENYTKDVEQKILNSNVM